MTKQKFDCIIIGGGPGGYISAIRAAQRGLQTALIEAKDLGGVCLNQGCIPSKALIANARVLRKVRESAEHGISAGPISFDYGVMSQRKDQTIQKLRRGIEGLIAANKITLFNGFGRFLSGHEIAVTGKQEAILEADSIIIATGSVPREILAFPFDYKQIHDSSSLLDLQKLPKSIVIVGGGVIGCEFASLYNSLDVDVTIVELLPTILSTEGKQMGETLASIFKKKGIKIETGAQIQKIDQEATNIAVHLTDGRILKAEIALVAVGRKFNTDKIGLEKTGVIVNDNGSIPTNLQMQTNVPHIYAIGDITGKWILAHVASHQGIVAAEHAAGHPAQMDYRAVPSVIFTYPEVGSVGLTLEKALELGLDATIGKFPFQALGKSQAILETEGFSQIVVMKKTGQILGAQVVGYEAATLIAEMALAIQQELTIESITETIHAHPTIAEGWLEAAYMAEGLPLHLPPKSKGAQG